ncbi:ferredoxin [Actinosynnema sp. ALI-1.44]|uniref:ferredoxin n=1 Tax=Actinosynnema sp. ALI-1.44 TaxID=1933779 RepID=UPI00097C3221|nr:ferredoxin [Actinosynnema sp. ALI-1.44]ONI78136.1 ferredoxin [Actinosynnema sp. ALI-1.44]
MLIDADRSTCVVSSLCVYRAPGVFDQDEDGHVVVVDHEPAPELHESVRRAVRGCPTQSIRITEDD